jgi:hypothetical protein
MKRSFALIILAGILILSIAFAGCQSGDQPGSEKTPEPTITDQATQQPTATPETSEEPAENIDEADALAELKALLPEKEGYKWVYNGFAEYGHTLVLDQIKEEDGKVVYSATGEIDDMSGGESDRDFSLSVTYTLTPQSITQEKTGEMMMDIFDKVVLIQAPLDQGNTWTQTVKNEDGAEITLECTIEEIEENDGAKVYTVTYQDKNSPYYEKRVIREGIGVINFTRLYITDEENFEISYFIYEEASGYEK